MSTSILATKLYIPRVRLENVKFVPTRSKKALTVRFDEDTFEELSGEAREIGIGPSTLACMLILEQLRARRAS